jgi:hypothetical protein
MNERIKELWSQAGGHYNSGNQHTWPEYTIDDPKKFALLIVRENMDVVAKKCASPTAYNALAENWGIEE